MTRRELLGLQERTTALPTILVEELVFDDIVTLNPGVYAWYDWPEYDDWDVLTWTTGSPADNNTRFARDECGLDYEL